MKDSTPTTIATTTKDPPGNLKNIVQLGQQISLIFIGKLIVFNQTPYFQLMGDGDHGDPGENAAKAVAWEYKLEAGNVIAQPQVTQANHVSAILKIPKDV